MSIVENIKSLCDAKGTSIPRVEKELGFGRGSIYNWEKSSPSIDKIEKIAKHFNVSINRILYGFDADKFSNLTNIAKGNRTITEFVSETGVDHNELIRICLGYTYGRPALETVKRIAAQNQNSILFTEDDFLEAAGYLSERQISVARKEHLRNLLNTTETMGFMLLSTLSFSMKFILAEREEAGQMFFPLRNFLRTVMICSINTSQNSE